MTLTDCRNLPFYGIAPIALLVCVPVLGQPAFEDCSAPGLLISLDPIEDVINVPAAPPIADVHVDVTIPHAFIGDVVMDISSPDQISVRLHDPGRRRRRQHLRHLQRPGLS